MSRAQKGIGSNFRGAKSQLLVNRTVSQDCKTRHTYLCIAWINYKEVYDSVPQSWILEHLEMYNIIRTLIDFIKNSMGLWTMLFCIGLNLLSQITTKNGNGYKFQSRETINNLLYMDDIKLYARNE